MDVSSAGQRSTRRRVSSTCSSISEELSKSVDNLVVFDILLLMPTFSDKNRVTAIGKEDRNVARRADKEVL